MMMSVPPAKQKPPYHTLGEIVKHLRTKKQLSQNELGLRLGVQQAIISRIENGTIQRPSREMIWAMAQEFGYPAGKLYELANWPGALLLPEEVAASLGRLMPNQLEDVRLFGLLLSGVDVDSDAITPEFRDRLLGYAQYLKERDENAEPDASVSDQ